MLHTVKPFTVPIAQKSKMRGVAVERARAVRKASLFAVGAGFRLSRRQYRSECKMVQEARPRRQATASSDIDLAEGWSIPRRMRCAPRATNAVTSIALPLLRPAPLFVSRRSFHVRPMAAIAQPVPRAPRASRWSKKSDRYSRLRRRALSASKSWRRSPQGASLLTKSPGEPICPAWRCRNRPAGRFEAAMGGVASSPPHPDCAAELRPRWPQ